MIPGEIALLLAIKCHGNQMRWNNAEPYVSHPIRVANAAYVMTKDACLYQAAILHDVIEDTELTLKQLEEEHNCPPKVLKMVDILTKRKSESRSTYLKRLKASKDRGVLLIKILDSFDNAMHNQSAIQYLKDNGRDPVKERAKYIDTAKDLFELVDYGPTVTFHINNIFTYFENMEKIGFPESKLDLMIDMIRNGVHDTNLL